MKNINFYTMVIVNHRNKKIYQVYFNIYKSYDCEPQSTT